MKTYAETNVWNFDLPPYPREGVFHLDLSPRCQVNRLLTFEAGRLARLHQLDLFDDQKSLSFFQDQLRSRLWDKFGCTYDRSLPLEVKEFGTIREKDYSITKLIYQSRPGIFVTALLYIPAGEGPFPAVLQMHGHNAEGKFGENPQSMSLALVKSGYVCLTVDAIGTYERGHHCYQEESHGGFIGVGLFNIGESLMGAQVVDNMRGIDLLCSLAYVDSSKIGATGASGGGNQTMWLSAMDTRIAASMPVVSVGSFESYVYGLNCVCELLPDGLTITEESGILALIAPRHLRVGNALYDCNHDFSVSEMLKTYHPVEKLYWNLGVPEKISFEVADRVHGMTNRQRESVLGFFAYALKGEGNGRPLPEPDYEIYPKEELYLFKNPEERGINQVRSIQEHCQLTGEKLRKDFLSRTAVSVADAVKDLKKLLRLRALPTEMDVYHYAEVNGTGRSALAVGNHLIPFLIRKGTASGKYRIVLHPEGKKCLDQETLDQAAADGATLILPDLFGAGETAQPNNVNGIYHQFFRQLLWIGHSLTGEWVYDLLALVNMLKDEFNAEKIHVTAIREMGFTALCANAFSDRINTVETVASPGSLLFDAETLDLRNGSPFRDYHPNLIYSLALSLPGFLQWGDISLIAALGHGKISFHSLRNANGVPYEQEAVQKLMDEIETVRQKLVSAE